MIITIDGPAGSGKSILARKISEDLKFDLIQSGNFYRTIAKYVISKQVDCDDEDDVKQVINENVFCWDEADNFFKSNALNFDNDLRSHKIDVCISQIAKHPSIRDYVNSVIIKLSADRNIVCEGRDMGTHVFPNAELKLYLTASEDVRAKRLHGLENTSNKIDLTVVKSQMLERDNQDMERQYGALKIPKGAYIIDTTGKELQEIFLKVLVLLAESGYTQRWDWNKATEDSWWTKPAFEVYSLENRWANGKEKLLLDLGCGLGRNAIYFSQQGFMVEAIDLSEIAIGILKKNVAKLQLTLNAVIHDMAELPYQDEHFGFVLAYHSIYHTNEKGIKAIIQEIFRVLSVNGEAFITLLSKDDPIYIKTKPENKPNGVIYKVSGYETGVPHIYLDKQQVEMLVHPFRIINFYKKTEYWDENNYCHYYLLLKK